MRFGADTRILLNIILEKGVTTATSKANETVAQWDASVRPRDGSQDGLYYSTDKTICRCSGAHTNVRIGACHEWNDALADPMMKWIAPAWEKVFVSRLTQITNKFNKDAPVCLHKMRQEVEDERRKAGLRSINSDNVQVRIGQHIRVLKDDALSVKAFVTATQKRLNGEFIPVIAEAMLPAYEQCAQVRGASLASIWRLY